MELNIKLDRQGKKPLFLQIAEQIVNDINLGVIKQGTRLPAERKLAKSLSVNRSTVINAYNELTDRGYVQSHIGSGTTVTNVDIETEKEDIFVWRDLLSGQAESLINPYNSALKELLSERNLIAMDAGIADPDHYPKKALADISQELLLSEGNMLLQHGSPQGLLSLRESIVSIMKSRGIHSQVENVIVLNGSQQGLDLVSRILLEPGDSIILEEPSFLGAIDVFRTYGVRLVAIPTDGEGMVIDYLEKAIKRTKPKFIYTIPTYHNPTGLSLSSTRRKELLKIANRNHVPILEDDPYGLICFDNQPFPALKALDSTESVIYLSTFSKVIANGIRLGWMVAPPELTRIVVAAKQINDMHSGNFIQRMIDVYYRKGFFEQQILDIRGKYKLKRDTMLKALAKYAPEGMSWNTPQGGYFVWATLPDGLSAIKVLEEAVHNKVAFVAGPVFYLNDNGLRKIRLNYSYVSLEDINRGIKILCNLIESMKKKFTKNRVLEKEYLPIV